MTRTDVTTAINTTIDPVVTYHTDPRGWSMFRALVSAFAGPLRGATGQHVYSERSASFNGWATSPQRFTGMAKLGSARPIVATSSTLVDQKEANPLNSLAQTLFLERMQRGSR